MQIDLPSTVEYQYLAEFRRQIRQFLFFSESAAREQGIEPQQHQLMLAVAGLPDGVRPTIRELSSRLFIHHNSAVEVLIRLTPRGDQALHHLAVAHRSELERSGPELARALNAVLERRAGN